MNSPNTHPNETGENGAPTTMTPSHPVRFHVYKNATFLGETAFHQNHIAIGSSPDADLVLEHQAIAAFHAFVFINNGQIFLSNKYPNNGLRLNGNAVKEAQIHPENIIDIGPFSLHINFGNQAPGDSQSSATSDTPSDEGTSDIAAATGHGEEESVAPETYSVVLLNRFSGNEDRRQAAERLARFVRADVSAVAAALKKPTLVVKKQLVHSDALRLQQMIQSAGLPCFIQEDVVPEQLSEPVEDKRRSVPVNNGKTVLASHLSADEDEAIPAESKAASTPDTAKAVTPVKQVSQAAAPAPVAPEGSRTLFAALEAVPKPSTSGAKSVEIPVEEKQPATEFGASDSLNYASSSNLPETHPAVQKETAAESDDEINFSDIASEITQIIASEPSSASAKQDQSRFSDSNTALSEQTLDAPLPLLLDEDDTTSGHTVNDTSIAGTTADVLEIEEYVPPVFGLSTVEKDNGVEEIDLTDIAVELALESETVVPVSEPDIGFSGSGTAEPNASDDDKSWLLLEPEAPEDNVVESKISERSPLKSIPSDNVSTDSGMAATMAMDVSVPDMALEIERGLTAQELTAENSAPIDTAETKTPASRPSSAAEQSVPGSFAATADFSAFGYDDDEDEDDDEGIWEAPFCLDEQLCQSTSPVLDDSATANQVHVVKTINGVVMDAGVLKQGSRYTINTISGSFILADNKSGKGANVFFDSHFGGYTVKNGQVQADLTSFQNSDYLFHKKKEIYRLSLDEDSIVVVEDGDCQYRVFRTHESPEPELDLTSLPIEAAAESWNWRHWVGSFAVHIIVVMLIATYGLIQSVPKKDDKPHFVKIDTSMIEQMQEMKKPVEKPKPPPEPKPEPMQVAEKVAAKPTKQPVAQKSPEKPTKSPKKAVASASQPSRDPNAGGGFGEGNVKNRNINQTGLLSILSKTDLGGPSEAIAAVTNLDAVKVPGATDKNFTVGGIKGSLGDGKISVTPASAESGGSGIMQTKGAKQVLRSAGASGPGTVAAMEKGKTGNRKVQAMVTAKMTQSVKIEGGMSREAVKRVIDQHISEISYCYESALMTNPSISGRVTFEWKILGSGKVGEIRIVSSSLNSDDLHRRIKALIKTWQFPEPVGGAEVVVSYPFVFDQVGF